MHCPSCGLPATSDQLFCRQCGMNLLMVGQLVNQHAGEPENKLSHRKSEQELVSCMFKWISWGMLVLGLGVIMLVTGKTLVNTKLSNPDVAAWLRLVSTYVILGGTGMAAFGVLNALRQGASLSAGRRASSLEEAVDTKQLPTNPIPQALPSVTERTTQLISADAVTKSEVEVKR